MVCKNFHWLVLQQQQNAAGGVTVVNQAEEISTASTTSKVTDTIALTEKKKVHDWTFLTKL